MLIRQLDTLDEPGKPWLPCPLGGASWCAKFSDRWATSIVNRDARVTYFETLHGGNAGGVGGLVLSPAVQIFCAYADDGNSMDQNKVCTPLGGDGRNCIPGCYPVGQQCADMRRDWLCSYPPSQLRDALEAQRTRDGGLLKNNEIVVSTKSVTDLLPNSVEAFFIVRGSASDERQKVLAAHAAFLRAYPRMPSPPPLLYMDLHSDELEPFSPFGE